MAPIPPVVAPPAQGDRVLLGVAEGDRVLGVAEGDRVLLGVAEGDAMPLAVAGVLALLLLGTAGLLAWVGARATSGRLDRNQLVGLRTPRTLASDQAWAIAHRVAGPWLIAGAAAVGLPGLALLARPTNALGSLLVLVGSGLLVSLVAVGCILGDRAAGDA